MRLTTAFVPRALLVGATAAIAAACMTATLLGACGSDATPSTDTAAELGPGDTVSEVDASATDALSEVIAAIDWRRMKAHVDHLASDALGGRIPGSLGHEAARAYLVAELEAVGLAPFGDAGGYEQTYPQAGRSDRFQLDAEGAVVPNVSETGVNLVGIIRGADPVMADEYVVLMAHYDHIGVDAEGTVYNGAFDNAGGTAALLEIARVMLAHELRLERSLILIWTDGEEDGLQGADHWIMNAPVARERIVVGISADPVGRSTLPDYSPIALVGLERSPELKAVVASTAASAGGVVGFINRQMILGFASDQDTFHNASVPGLWFITPGMTYYHTTDDTADTIDYRVMRQATCYLLQIVAAVGEATGPFPYRGPAPLSPSDLADGRPLVAGLLGSSHLSADERARAESFLAEIDKVIAADSLDALTQNQGVFLVELLAFLAFELPSEHPGPIPPPPPQD